MEHDDDTQPGQSGLSDLFAQFEQAQERIESAAEKASATVVEGSAAGGRVVVRLSGDLDAVSVHIDPALVDPDDVGMLEDLLLAAIRDGLGQVAELQEEVAGAFGGPGGIDIAGLLGNLGNMGGMSDLGGLGNLAGFDLDAIARLPGLGASGGLGGGLGPGEAYGGTGAGQAEGDDAGDTSDEEDEAGPSGLG